MNWQNVQFDWNQVRAFLVTAEEGSLSAAARALQLTQPTLSRQVAALEESLEVVLFERVGRGLVLTETGMTLLEHVKDMGAAAGRVSLAASGRSETIEGLVTVTATDLVSAYLLPPVLKTLSRTAPGIRIDVVAANDIRDLQRREADIALRNAEPKQPDLIARRLKDTQANFYAMPDYFAANGRPKNLIELQEAVWVGYGTAEQMVQALGAFGLDMRADRFRYTCENSVVVWEMIRAGLGIGILTDDMRARCPEAVQVLPDFPPIPVPLWLITHRELRTSRRIRVVFDALAAALG